MIPSLGELELGFPSISLIECFSMHILWDDNFPFDEDLLEAMLGFGVALDGISYVPFKDHLFELEPYAIKAIPIFF